MRKIYYAIIACAVVWAGCYTIRTPQVIEIKPTDIVENVVKTACLLQWRNKGQPVVGGSATCIDITKDKCYLLTAKHIAKLPVPFTNFVREAMSGKLAHYNLWAVVWQYDSRGFPTKQIEREATVVWMSAKTDLAIVTIDVAGTPLNSASLASRQDYRNMKIGHVVMRAGCPDGLPPMFVRGYVSRFNVAISYNNMVLDMYTIRTWYGDSGSGIFLADNNKVVAVCATARPPLTYVCGAVPVVRMFEELQKTEYKFLVPTN